MDTVNDYSDYLFPFTLYINGQRYEHNDEEFEVLENSDINIFFNSSDKNARFYLEALDIMPNNQVNPEIFEDEKGKLYHIPSVNSFDLIKHSKDNNGSLYVDSFPITITAKGREFHGRLTVKPKQLSDEEWKTMREDIENEIKGLARDMTKKRIGDESSLINPDRLRSYLIIKKHYKSILGALSNLKDKANYRISVSGGKKVINYDIQDNRVLKSILGTYEKELKLFIKELEGKTDPSIKRFYENALKLKKATGLIKSQDWFKDVKKDTTGRVPHSFAMDPRYSILYKLHRELERPEIEVVFDEFFPWKESSYLYELWCFIRLCREMEERCIRSDSFIEVDQKVLFPRLDPGTMMNFVFDKFRIELIYNQSLSYSGNTDSPIYTLSRHRTPDIIVNVYALSNTILNEEVFLGTFIIECKYRRYDSYWRNISTYSQDQIFSYLEGIQSERLILDALEYKKAVRSLIILTPDEYVDTLEQRGDKIIHMCVRPRKEMGELADLIYKESEKLFNKYQKISNKFLEFYKNYHLNRINNFSTDDK